MDKVKLIKEIEHIAMTYEFEEIVRDHTYEEFTEDWGKDIYEYVYVDYVYNEYLEKLIVEDLIYLEKYTKDEILQLMKKAKKVILKSNVSSNTNEIKSLKSKIDELQAQLQELLNDDED